MNIEGSNKFSVNEYSRKWWQEIYQRIIGGVVFIEDCLAECLHWDGGLLNLTDAGAITAKCLSPFENGSKNHKKAIFITKGTNINLETVKEIIANSHFVNCILIIASSLEVISSERNCVTSTELEDMVISWINKKPCAVEIFFAPIFAVAITNNIFTTPIYAKLFPKFGDKLHSDQPMSVDLHTLPLNDKNEVRRLASSLNNLFEQMNLKDDIYFMGTFSSILAGVLEHLPAAALRRKNASNNVSVILVDRTVDLCGVSSHGSESLLDKIMSILPRFPGHSLDVAVNMSPLCEADMVSVSEDEHLCPGFISHPNNEQNVQILNQLINKTQPEVMLGLYNKLSGIVAPTPTRLPPRVTPQNLEKLVINLKGRYNLIEEHCELLQQTLAVIQTLKSPQVQETELLMSLEKQILQNLSTSRDSTSVLTQISNIIKNRKQRGLSLEHLLSLLVFLYSTAGSDVTFSEAQEKQLQESLKVALFEDQNDLSLNYEDSEFLSTEEGCGVFASKLVKRLKDISITRQFLVKYKSVIKVIDEISPTEYRSILQQLVYDLVDVEKPDMPDLKYRTDGLKGFLRSGLNILMSTASKKTPIVSKHPFDNPLVIIFIVGGTTAEECKKLHQAIITSGTDTDVLIGSTTLLNPIDTMRQALFLV